jgi:hypothetical protein
MPKGSAWIKFVYVNLGFLAQVFVIYFYTQVKVIKENWPAYRCNPMYMPLSDNIASDFIYCVQSMQTNFMGYLLEPLNYLLSSLNAINLGFIDDIGNVRGMFNYVRNSITSVIVNIFGVFINIVVEFQRIIVGLKDLVGKMIGIVVSVLYIVDGSLKTMNSSWNGPPGQMVRVMGSCFHPETKVRLANGSIVAMKDVEIGDVLVGGSKVRATMKIANSSDEPFYKFEGRGVDGSDIYVTGSHHVGVEIYDNEHMKHLEFIQVKKHSHASLTTEKTEWFSCLITEDHRIALGDNVFWDWEDHFL